MPDQPRQRTRPGRTGRVDHRARTAGLDPRPCRPDDRRAAEHDAGLRQAPAAPFHEDQGHERVDRRRTANVRTPRRRTAAGSTGSGQQRARRRQPAEREDPDRRGRRRPAPRSAPARRTSGRRSRGPHPGRRARQAEGAIGPPAAGPIRPPPRRRRRRRARSAPSVRAPRQPDQRQQAEEHEPPADGLADGGRDRRAEHAGQDPGRRQRGEHPRPERSRAGSGRSRRRRSAGSRPRQGPGGTRAAIRTGIDGARPPMSRPIANRPSPSTNGIARPRRSIAPPTTTIPTSEPRKNAEKTQPYSSRPAQLAGHGRHDGRDRQGFERDEGHRQDETDRQGPASCAPQALIGRGVHGER